MQGRSTNSWRETFKAFTDAAVSSVARAIAEMKMEASRERELREAQFAARMAELETRIAAVRTLEKALADKMDTVRSGEPGRSVTIDDVAPMITGEIEKRMNDLPSMIEQAATEIMASPVTIEDVEAMARKSVSSALEIMPPPRTDDDIKSIVNDIVAGLPPVEPERVDTDMLRSMVDEAVSNIPPPSPGKDADPEEIAAMVADAVRAAVAGLQPAEPDPELLRSMVDEAVSNIPPAAPGKDADPDEIAAMVADAVRAAVDGLPPPEKGDPGPPGSLPLIGYWEDKVYYTGDVVTFCGEIFQALRDTGKAPPNDDWQMIVRRGLDGADGRSPTVRNTWRADEDYQALDIVSLNGAAFIARHDDPGVCPGAGWQMIAMQGKTGKPGKQGERGIAVTSSVSEVSIDDDGVLSLVNADGTAVTCDLYPILSKVL
ncbi:hypothetical protein [Martelella soudanensis]|uniref:hypothetical protein n=1 Tax=unclassified Martelella TaxID=2629616 RepID=UPI0015DF93E0|nr:MULTISPECIES: hypothetical protein [unclassified Martelella]